MKKVNQRILASFVIVGIITGLGLLAQRYTSLDWLIAQEDRLRTLVRERPVTTWLYGLGLYTGLSLIPGTTGKAVIVGWLFGFWWAIVMVDLALTAAALVMFTASRFLFREVVEARYGAHLNPLRKRFESGGAFYLLTARLLHAPYSFMNLTTGATNLVPLRTFWWTTQLGMLPGIAVFVFAGTRMPRLAEIATGGVWRLLDPPLIAALLATAVFPLVLKLLVAVVRRRV